MAKQVRKSVAKKAAPKKVSAKSATPTMAVKRRSVLHHALKQGRFGINNTSGPGITFNVRHPMSIASIMARKGKAKALSAALKKSYGAESPAVGQSSIGKKLNLHWCGNEQFFAISQDATEGWLYENLVKTTAGLASISDQSHGRVIISISGPQAEKLLAKGTPIDLHNTVFPIGASAMTQMAHIGVHVVRVSDSGFEVSVFRGFAESYWQWLTEMALEYGYEVL